MIKEVKVEFMDNEPICSEYVCVMEEESTKATILLLSKPPQFELDSEAALTRSMSRITDQLFFKMIFWSSYTPDFI